MLAKRGAVTGIDIAPEAVERARSRTKGTFIESAVPPVPLDDDSFDAVISFETIEHVDEDAHLIEEFKRVLKPGGTLLIRTSRPRDAYRVRIADAERIS